MKSGNHTPRYKLSVSLRACVLGEIISGKRNYECTRCFRVLRRTNESRATKCARCCREIREGEDDE